MQFPSLGGEDPLEEGTATHSSILALRIPMDREAWCAAVHGETESNTTEGLNNSSYVPGTRYPGKKKKVRQGFCSHGLYIPRDKTKLKYQ